MHDRGDKTTAIGENQKPPGTNQTQTNRQTGEPGLTKYPKQISEEDIKVLEDNPVQFPLI